MGRIIRFNSNVAGVVISPSCIRRFIPTWPQPSDEFASAISENMCALNGDILRYDVFVRECVIDTVTKIGMFRKTRKY